MHCVHLRVQAAAAAWLIGGLDGSAQYRETSEIRLHRRIMTGAASVPAPPRLDQRGAHAKDLALAGWEILDAPSAKAAWQLARMPPQLQPAQRPHRYTFGFRALRHALRDLAREVLVVQAVGIAFRAGGSDPLLAPGLQLLARALQACVRQRDRETRQVERLAQRCLEAVGIEQLLDVAEVCREHPRAGGGCGRRGRSAMGDGSSRRVGCAAGIFAYFILHETNPLVLWPRPCGRISHPAASGRPRPERGVQGA